MFLQDSFSYTFRLSGGYGQNFELLLSRGEWGFCPFSFKFGGFDRVPEALVTQSGSTTVADY